LSNRYIHDFLGRINKLKEHDKYVKLFSKYLSGNITDQEQLAFEAWLKQSPDHQMEYDDFKRVWSYTALDNTGFTFDVDAGWKELNLRIKAVESLSTDIKEHKTVFSKQFLYIATRVAAILVIAFGLYFIFNSIKTDKKPLNLEYTALEIPTQPITLPDGSEIIPNIGATISYPEVFASETRKIDFSGEAYFNIAHNPDKPFIISSGGLQIKVLGTSFNFCTCPEGDHMVLYLESGKVQFSSLNVADGSISEQLILMPGQKGIFNKKSGLISKSEFTNQNFLAWKTGVLVFEKTPLDEVLSAIERTYHLNIEANRSLEAYNLTATFEKETPESIFESIHTIFGIEYAIDGQNVVLN